MTKKTRKVHYQMVEWVSIALISIAIILYLYPIIANKIADEKRSVAISHYDDTIEKQKASQLKEQLRVAQKYNEWLNLAQKGEVGGRKAPNYKNSLLKDTDVMGKLTVPAIDIKEMPFFDGATSEVLDKGLGHLEYTSIPIGGKNTRAVITGHTGVTNQKLFSDINRLKKGDVFYIQILNKKLMYKITKIIEVYPDETDKIKIKEGKDLVTLLTCTPPGINTKRLLVTGSRTKYIQESKLKYVKRDFWSYEHIVLMLLALLLLVIAIGWILRRKRKALENGKKTKEKVE